MKQRAAYSLILTLISVLCFGIFFHGIGFLWLASWTHSPSDMLRHVTGLSHSRKLFAAIVPFFQGTKDQIHGGFFKRGYPRDEFGPGRRL